MVLETTARGDTSSNVYLKKGRAGRPTASTSRPYRRTIGGELPPIGRPTPLERLLAACPDDLASDRAERRQSIIAAGRAAQAFAKEPGIDLWAVPHARAIETAARELVQGGQDDGSAFTALGDAVRELQTAVLLWRADLGRAKIRGRGGPG